MRGSVSKRGGQWYAIVDAPRDASTGKRRQIKRAAGPTKKHAERLLAQLLVELDNPRTSSPQPNSGDYLARWLETISRTVSPKTLQRYAEIVNLHLAPAIGHIPITDLSAEILDRYYQYCIAVGRPGGAPLSQRSVEHIHRCLHTALQAAVRRGLIAHNPADNVDPPRGRQRPMETLTPADVLQLLAASRETAYYIPILLAVSTGMRRGEILGLHWRDVDLDNGRISVRHSVQNVFGQRTLKTPKSGRARVVDLPDEVVQKLRELKVKRPPDGDGAEKLVVTDSNGGMLHPDTLSKGFRRIASRIGITVRFHDLRHTHATLLLLANMHPKIVSERLGHSTISITLDIYSHVIPSMQREAAMKINEILKGQRSRG